MINILAYTIRLTIKTKQHSALCGDDERNQCYHIRKVQKRPQKVTVTVLHYLRFLSNE